MAERRLPRQIRRLLPDGYEPLGAAALAAGWDIRETRSHIEFVPPEGAKTPEGDRAATVHCPRTPSDYNSKFRVRGKLRRNGVQV